MFHQLRYEGTFTPPSLQGTLVFPGNLGMFEWGGIAVDPVRQIAIANPMALPFASRLIPRGPLPPARDTSGGDIAVQFLTSTEEFARLAPDWNRLHAQAVAASVFNSWLFQYQWWQVYGAGQPLRLLVALERGETVGILALYIQKVVMLGVPIRVLRFVGSGGDTHPDDLGPVLVPGRELTIASKLARAALRLSDFDVAVLSWS